MVSINVSPEIGESFGGQKNNSTNSVNSGNSAMQNQNTKNSVQEKTIMSTDLPSGIKKNSDVKNENSGDAKPEEIPKKKSHWWVWLLIVLFLIGVGIAAYFLILKDKLNLF